MPPEDNDKRSAHRAVPSTRALIVLNAILLVLLVAVTFAPAVSAQVRSRGEYTMVAGGVKGASSSAVFIVDTGNQEMMAITYNQQDKSLEGIAYRSLAEDVASVQRARMRPGN